METTVDSTPSAAARAARAAAPRAATTAAPRRLRAGDVGVHLDMQTIGEVCAGVGLEGWRTLVRSVLDDTSGHQRALRVAFERRAAAADGALDAADAQALAARAHALKGNAASMGLRGLCEAAQAAERHLKAVVAAAGEAAHPVPSRTEVASQLREAVEVAPALLVKMGFLPR